MLTLAPYNVFKNTLEELGEIVEHNTSLRPWNFSDHWTREV
jgi:hypothetical protein